MMVPYRSKTKWQQRSRESLIIFLARCTRDLAPEIEMDNLLAVSAKEMPWKSTMAMACAYIGGSARAIPSRPAAISQAAQSVASSRAGGSSSRGRTGAFCLRKKSVRVLLAIVNIQLEEPGFFLHVPQVKVNLEKDLLQEVIHLGLVGHTSPNESAHAAAEPVPDGVEVGLCRLHAL